jgi:2-polyprenyl-3-methyl-5-hydroxy-6-metoxy-1,4-benzoquinol methylase
MKLSRVNADWEHLAASDPYWAVLSDPDKQGGSWDVEEFYRSGVAEIDGVMEFATALSPSLAGGNALDFGCGPGRLTFALARHFDSVVGVDAASPMIELARGRAPEGSN